MNIENARNFVSKNQNLIGTTDEKGFVISDIIIIPQNSVHQDAFLRQFVRGIPWERLVVFYSNEEVEVWGVDKDYLLSSGIIFYSCLAK